MLYLSINQHGPLSKGQPIASPNPHFVNHNYSLPHRADERRAGFRAIISEAEWQGMLRKAEVLVIDRNVVMSEMSPLAGESGKAAYRMVVRAITKAGSLV